MHFPHQSGSSLPNTRRRLAALRNYTLSVTAKSAGSSYRRFPRLRRRWMYPHSPLPQHKEWRLPAYRQRRLERRFRWLLPPRLAPTHQHRSRQWQSVHRPLWQINTRGSSDAGSLWNHYNCFLFSRKIKSDCHRCIGCFIPLHAERKPHIIQRCTRCCFQQGAAGSFSATCSTM